MGFITLTRASYGTPIYVNTINIASVMEVCGMTAIEKCGRKDRLFVQESIETIRNLIKRGGDKE